MAYDEFIDNLRYGSKMLLPPAAETGQGKPLDSYYRQALHHADLWLTPKVVEGFSPNDFADWPHNEREELSREVKAFRAIAEQVPADKPATRAQSEQGRKHLQRIIDLVRRPILERWLDAQESLMEEAKEGARSRGWYAEQDEITINENLLGTYKAPRLRVRNIDKEVYLKPVAYFGSGKQGIVDLVVLPTYEPAYYVVFKNGEWQIVSSVGGMHRRRFTRDTFVNTLARLPK